MSIERSIGLAYEGLQREAIRDGAFTLIEMKGFG